MTVIEQILLIVLAILVVLVLISLAILISIISDKQEDNFYKIGGTNNDDEEDIN